ncbi:MAG: MFS transporter [Deltaproteobacteria bacterium]|nr:MFS transporter [Deltaproteobacteria bacterium]
MSDGPAPAGNAYSKTYTGYVLWMVFLVMVFNNVDRTIVSILVRPIKAEFGLSDTEMGWLLGPAFSIVYSMLVLPMGRWADSGGVRRSIVAGCLFAWSMFTAATAIVQTYIQLFIARMGVGIGEAGATSPSVSMLSDYLAPESRARGMSVVSIGAVTGMGLGMIAGGWLEEIHGWRAAFVAAGLPGALLAIIFRLTIREPVRGANEGRIQAENPPFWPSLRFLLNSWTYRFILLANAFSLFAAMGRNLWEPSFLIRSYGLNEFTSGVWYFLTSPVPSAFGVFLGGYLADRLGKRDARWYMWVPALGQTLSIPILVAFLLWPADDVLPLPGFLAIAGLEALPVAFVLSFFGSIVGSFFTAPFMATIQSVSPLRMRAFAAAVSTLISTLIGLTIGPLLVGALSDAITERFAEEALRYSLLVPTVAPIFSALVCVIGARSVGDDLDRVRSANV